MRHGDALWPGAGAATNELGFRPSSSPFSKKHLHYFRVEVKRIGSELNAIGDIHQLELIAVRLGGYVCG